MFGGAHPDQNEQPVLIRDKKVKWSDFGATPMGASPALVSYHGEVWLKSGYAETMLWRRVRLTKVKQIDLTTDGLWAMPLHTGWVAAKAHTLQDFEKLKKYIPANKRGGVCPKGVQALRDTAGDDPSE